MAKVIPILWHLLYKYSFCRAPLSSIFCLVFNEVYYMISCIEICAGSLCIQICVLIQFYSRKLINPMMFLLCSEKFTGSVSSVLIQWHHAHHCHFVGDSVGALTTMLINFNVGNFDLGFLMSSDESDADTSGDMFL